MARQLPRRRLETKFVSPNRQLNETDGALAGEMDSIASFTMFESLDHGDDVVSPKARQAPSLEGSKPLKLRETVAKHRSSSRQDSEPRVRRISNVSSSFGRPLMVMVLIFIFIFPCSSHWMGESQVRRVCRIFVGKVSVSLTPAADGVSQQHCTWLRVVGLRAARPVQCNASSPPRIRIWSRGGRHPRPARALLRNET